MQPLPTEDRVPRPLTAKQQKKLARVLRAKAGGDATSSDLNALVHKFGKQYDPKQKPAKCQHDGGIPDPRPGTVNWRKQESIALDPGSQGGRHKKPSGKKG